MSNYNILHFSIKYFGIDMTAPANHYILFGLGTLILSISFMFFSIGFNKLADGINKLRKDKSKLGK